MKDEVDDLKDYDFIVNVCVADVSVEDTFYVIDEVDDDFKEEVIENGIEGKMDSMKICDYAKSI